MLKMKKKINANIFGFKVNIFKFYPPSKPPSIDVNEQMKKI